MICSAVSGPPGLFRLLSDADEFWLSDADESWLTCESVLPPNATLAALESWEEKGDAESCCGICCALPLLGKINKTPTASTARTRRRSRPGEFRENADWIEAIGSTPENVDERSE